MKPLKAALAILFLAGNMESTTASAAGVSGVISKDALAAGDYCHMKFAAIREETLGSSHPVLKEANEGDIVDFYGPCSHDPLGKEEVQAQLSNCSIVELAIIWINRRTRIKGEKSSASPLRTFLQSNRSCF